MGIKAKDVRRDAQGRRIKKDGTLWGVRSKVDREAVQKADTEALQSPAYRVELSRILPPETTLPPVQASEGKKQFKKFILEFYNGAMRSVAVQSPCTLAAFLGRMRAAANSNIVELSGGQRAINLNYLLEVRGLSEGEG